MKKSLMLTIVILLLSGCETVGKEHALSAEDAARLKGKTVVVTAPKEPTLFVTAPGSDRSGILYTLVQANGGKGLIEKYNLTSPAELTAKQLSKVIATTYSSNVLADPILIDGNSKDVVTMAKNKADYIFDVRQLNWEFRYVPSDTKNWAVGFTVWARLIDSKSSEVIADKTCFLSKATGLNYEDLLANTAEKLKSENMTLVEGCVKLLQNQMFSAKSAS